MGGNGTASILGYVPEEKREYISLGTYHDSEFGDIEIIEFKKNAQNKMPPESNSAPRMYVAFDKNGKGVNEIAKYGSDHKKEWSIHVPGHNKEVNGPHVHQWSNGEPLKPKLLLHSDPRYGLLQRLLNISKTKK